MYLKGFLKVGVFHLTTPSSAVEGEEVLGPLLIRDATAGPRSVNRATNACLTMPGLGTLALHYISE